MTVSIARLDKLRLEFGSHLTSYKSIDIRRQYIFENHNKR